MTPGLALYLLSIACVFAAVLLLAMRPERPESAASRLARHGAAKRRSARNLKRENLHAQLQRERAEQEEGGLILQPAFDHPQRACLSLFGGYLPTPAAASAEILARVAAEHRVPVPVILSKVRTRRVARARQAVMHALRTERKLSFPVIARILGLKDHATVIHGVRAHQARAASA